MQLDVKNKILAVDVDGVVYPYHTMMKKQLGARVKDVSRYKLYEAFENTTIEAVHQAHLRLFETVDSHATSPIPGASASLHNLHKLGVQIIFVTARADYTKKLTGDDQPSQNITKAWLSNWAPPHQVYFVKDKIDYNGHYDCLIDDRPKEIDLLLNNGRHAICYSQPYNQDYHRTWKWQWRPDGKVSQLLEILNNLPKL